MYWYEDNANTTVNGFPEFRDLLEEREQNSEWLPVVPVKELSYEGNDFGPINAVSFSEEHGTDYDATVDTLEKGTKLFACIDCRNIPVRDCALDSIFDRAKIGGKSLLLITRKMLGEHLTEYSKVCSGKALARVADGKVNAILGGDDGEYQIIPALDVLDAANEKMLADFPKAVFKDGYFSHVIISFDYDLKEHAAEMMKSLVGTPYEDYLPYLRISTSDMGACSATVSPMLRKTGSRNAVPMNGSIKVPHKGTGSITKFCEALDMVYSQYQALDEAIERLKGIVLRNPVNAMKRVMKRAQVQKRAALDAADIFAGRIQSMDEVTALDAYFAISESVASTATVCGEDRMKLFRAEDAVARCFAVDWLAYDLPGEFNW